MVEDNIVADNIAVFPMIAVSILPHAEFGPNDH